MTDAVWHEVTKAQTAQDVPLPAPVPFATPVLIGDCATPLSGETVLSLIWKHLDGQRAP